ncbi:MAG: hypothetical protein JW994_05780 [Candidatus Omnitrophica bacterium]|nr:hypothetical protein [Candidatus Omnitrophota bacterium]
MFKFFALAALCVVVSCSPVACFSQEEEGNEEGNVEYSYGSVVDIKGDANQIVIKEYNLDNDAEEDVTYSVSADATCENVDSWKNIKKGAYVDIEYNVNADGGKIITYIGVYEPEEEETATESEADSVE